MDTLTDTTFWLGYFLGSGVFAVITIGIIVSAGKKRKVSTEDQYTP